jgi:hypothetical protein
MEMTWDPAARDCKMIAVVADPDENANAYFACSNAAIEASKLCLYYILAQIRQEI